MTCGKSKIFTRLFVVGMVLSGGLLLALSLIALAGRFSFNVKAAPIVPPDGYPKLSLSNKRVTPDLVSTGGATLTYTIEMVNTGAYTGFNVTMTDLIPANTEYNEDAIASIPPAPVYSNGMLTWNGTVGFDSSVFITFSVDVLPEFEGILTNAAEIAHESLDIPVVVTAEAMVTDDPLFEIEKISSPEKPGPNKPLVYTISITNRGQLAQNLPVIVQDVLPDNTSFVSADPDGSYNAGDKTVTWNRSVSLATGETEQFSYTVLVGDVPSGTVIYNTNYQVENLQSGLITAGEVYTVTVTDPILFLYKETDPFPPGSNREVTYTLKVFNKGSLATDLVISDTLPAGVTHYDGGSFDGTTVSWTFPSLDTGETAEFSFIVSIGDVAEVPVLNDNYQVCSAEGVCAYGIPLLSIVKGPTFEAQAFLDPIAKKPGGGGGPVTPTLTIKNLGPGNALAATAMLYFERISVSRKDMLVIPEIGSLTNGPDCGEKCDSFQWIGDLANGQIVTFTVSEGQSTIGGEEGTNYTATVVVSDTLGGFAYDPITASAVGKVTHFANLIPSKTAPSVIGAGQLMTYSLQVFNSGLSTDVPPYPTLTDTVPVSTTLVSVSDDGISYEIGERTVVSWTLPAMGPGDRQFRSFSVLVDQDLVSGTKIINDDYLSSWYDVALITQTYTLSNPGIPVTTVVKEVGLVDSFKTVTPTMALPGTGNYLTFTIHVVNSSPVPLADVSVHDVLPWQVSTYQRDAQATAGEVISDIVSVDWTGEVGPLSEELITFTVLVDPYYKGPVTNKATISHPSLKEDVIVEATAYVTDEPVLRITKTASPDPVKYGDELTYELKVTNLGQQASELVVLDTIPLNSSYVPYSASGNGLLMGDQIKWEFPVLAAGEDQYLSFRVKPNSLNEIINADYMVSCAEGVNDYGDPVVTKVIGGARVYLPLVIR